MPIFLLFVLLNLILGIVGDAFGEEKENPGELSEPTLIEDFLLALSYRYGRFMGRHPSFDALIRTLKAARKSSPPKSIDVLASALGAKPRPGVGDAVAEGTFRVRSSKAGPVTESSADVPVKLGSLAFRKNTPEASARARARWALVRNKGIKSNVLLKAMGVNMNELRTKGPAEHLEMAKEKGFGVLVDVLGTTKDVDSDSDSSVDEEVKARRHKQHVLRGTAKPSAWSAIKSHMVPPKVNKPGSEWQTLMDDTWSEFMTGIKARNTLNREANMFRIKDWHYTEEEVTEWLLDADLEARRAGYFGNRPPRQEGDSAHRRLHLREQGAAVWRRRQRRGEGARGDGRAHRGGSTSRLPRWLRRSVSFAARWAGRTRPSRGKTPSPTPRATWKRSS